MSLIKKTRRTLQEQTIKDSFMFEAVMTDGDNCKEFLEMILGKKLTHVEVSKEREMRSHPEYHGTRLDIFATDEYGTRYNIEMQVVTEFTPLRGRYYHSQMDMDILLAGTKYKYLPKSYVIFICDYDPLGYNKYIYEMDTKCRQIPELDYPDGVHTIFLSTKGTNEDETPEEIVKFLNYVSANLSESTQDFGSDFVSKLQQSVSKVKHNRSKEREFMVLDDLLEIEHREGFAECREEIIVNFLNRNPDAAFASEMLGLPIELIRKVADENHIILK